MQHWFFHMKTQWLFHYQVSLPSIIISPGLSILTNTFPVRGAIFRRNLILWHRKSGPWTISGWSPTTALIWGYNSTGKKNGGKGSGRFQSIMHIAGLILSSITAQLKQMKTGKGKAYLNRLLFSRRFLQLPGHSDFRWKQSLIISYQPQSFYWSPFRAKGMPGT